jgi:hypothetical protein
MWRGLERRVTEKTNNATTKIVDIATFRWAFLALVVLSAGLYVFGRLSPFAGTKSGWENWDFARLWIPPLAFVGWTMLQKTTAFDAIASNLAEAPRDTIAVILGAVLAVVAAKLGYIADQTTPPP